MGKYSPFFLSKKAKAKDDSKRSTLRALNAKRAKKVDRTLSGHSVWSGRVVLTNMGGKR